MIRLLLDQNTPYAAAALLAERGLDAVHARDLGLSHAPDSSILAAAASADRVVVSHDADFSQLLALGGRERPSVLHLRREFETNQEFVDCVLATIDTVRDEILAGAIVSVDESSVRVRLLPVLRPGGSGH